MIAVAVNDLAGRKSIRLEALAGKEMIRFFEKSAGLLVCVQQRLHLAAKFSVADRTEKLRSLGFGSLESLLEERLYSLPPLGGHAAFPALISRCNHAFAVCHCRSTVRGDTPITSAVSSTDKPVKKRSSTIRLLSGSTVLQPR